MAKVVKFPAEGATTDFSDEDISNVGSIALDEITSDSATSVTVTLGTDAGDDFIVGPSNKMVVEGDTGKVGVGTATPRRAVDVLDASNPQLRLSRTDDSNYADLEVSANNNLIASQVDNVIVQGNDTHTFIAIQNDAAFINTGVSNQVDSAVTSPTSGLTLGVNGTTGYILNRYAGELIIGTTNQEAIRIATDEDATFVANLSANGNVTLGDAADDTHTVNGTLALASEHSSGPSAPADGAGGILYVKDDGKLYFVSEDVTETDLTAGGGGGDLTIVTTSSATYALSTYNTMVIVDSSSNAVEVDLPTASGNAGKTVDILAKTGATNAVTVDPNAEETINGNATSYVINVNYGNLTLVSDGSNWVIR